MKNLETDSLKKKVLLITSGQPALNPRLVKEADALIDEGYDVTVLYAYWNDWGTKQDEILLNDKKWKAIRLGGDPKNNRIIYFISRIFYKLGNIPLQKNRAYKYFANIAIARSSYFLIKGAKKIKADLYIAHNLGALPAAAIASKKHKKIYGFDAEDFHRQEVSDDVNSQHFKLTKWIEDKYLPGASYLTSSSPLISNQYELLYAKKTTTILNVFPKVDTSNIVFENNGPLKLFWFSQTIGPYRGLELIIKAMGLAQHPNELHLLGLLSDNYKEQLYELCGENGVPTERITFYSPIHPNEIPFFASKFDIGLASEIPVCLNRDISLTNKLFTYLQAGLAIAFSNTKAQVNFSNTYQGIGQVYSNQHDLSMILDNYHLNRDFLFQGKKNANNLGLTELNWELESKKFIKVIEGVFEGRN